MTPDQGRTERMPKTMCPGRYRGMAVDRIGEADEDR